ncbi:hypothetical protein DIPPA_20068 [Diplonema papillatum]|nr:hypothetical protein DIPPA_20068 [Diplonema papillatum]
MGCELDGGELVEKLLFGERTGNVRRKQSNVVWMEHYDWCVAHGLAVAAQVPREGKAIRAELPTVEEFNQHVDNIKCSFSSRSMFRHFLRRRVRVARTLQAAFLRYVERRDAELRRLLDEWTAFEVVEKEKKKETIAQVIRRGGLVDFAELPKGAGGALWRRKVEGPREASRDRKQLYLEYISLSVPRAHKRHVITQLRRACVRRFFDRHRRWRKARDIHLAQGVGGVTFAFVEPEFRFKLAAPALVKAAARHPLARKATLPAVAKAVGTLLCMLKAVRCRRSRPAERFAAHKPWKTLLPRCVCSVVYDEGEKQRAVDGTPLAPYGEERAAGERKEAAAVQMLKDLRAFLAGQAVNVVRTSMISHLATASSLNRRLRGGAAGGLAGELAGRVRAAVAPCTKRFTAKQRLQRILLPGSHYPSYDPRAPAAEPGPTRPGPGAGRRVSLLSGVGQFAGSVCFIGDVPYIRRRYSNADGEDQQYQQQQQLLLPARSSGELLKREQTARRLLSQRSFKDSRRSTAAAAGGAPSRTQSASCLAATGGKQPQRHLIDIADLFQPISAPDGWSPAACFAFPYSRSARPASPGRARPPTADGRRPPQDATAPGGRAAAPPDGRGEWWLVPEEAPPPASGGSRRLPWTPTEVVALAAAAAVAGMILAGHRRRRAEVPAAKRQAALAEPPQGPPPDDATAADCSPETAPCSSDFEAPALSSTQCSPENAQCSSAFEHLHFPARHARRRPCGWPHAEPSPEAAALRYRSRAALERALLAVAALAGAAAAGAALGAGCRQARPGQKNHELRRAVRGMLCAVSDRRPAAFPVLVRPAAVSLPAKEAAAGGSVPPAVDDGGSPPAPSQAFDAFFDEILVRPLEAQPPRRRPAAAGWPSSSSSYTSSSGKDASFWYWWSPASAGRPPPGGLQPPPSTAFLASFHPAPPQDAAAPAGRTSAAAHARIHCPRAAAPAPWTTKDKVSWINTRLDRARSSRPGVRTR